MQRMEIHRLPTAGPDDVSGLARLIDDGTVSARDVIAVLGKTEGNGCVNDWSRGFSTAAYAALLATRLGTTPGARGRGRRGQHAGVQARGARHDGPDPRGR